MSVRYAVALLLLGVVGVPLSYGWFFDGMFFDNGRLPTWVIAMSLAVAAGISVAVLWWVKRTVSMGAELLLGAPAAWLAPSIGAVTFGGLAVWLSRRQVSRD